MRCPLDSVHETTPYWQRKRMKPRSAAAVETELLIELIARIKSLKVSDGPERVRTMALKCPCGEVILPPTPIIPGMEDRQRGLLKSRIKNHLWLKHGVSEYTSRLAINEAFA